MKSIFLSALAVAVFVVGCSSGKSFDGKWNVASDSPNVPKDAKIVATFSSPDKLAMTMDMAQPLPDGKKANLHVDIAGTYKVEGEMMTFKADDVKFSGTGFPPEIKSMMDSQMKAMGDQVKEQVNKEGSTKLKWVDNDTFTLTGKSGKPETFTRVK